MLVRARTGLLPAVIGLLVSIYPMRALAVNPNQWLLPVAFEVVVITLASFVFARLWKKQIRFESTDDGIRIAGSKEHVNDPDFVAYSDIIDVDHDSVHIGIVLRGGKLIRLRGLRRHAEAIVMELRQRLRTDSGRK